MKIFINRTGELTALNEVYAFNKAGFAVVYGRRRLGKTLLLKQFANEKLHQYFMATRAAEK
jgi:AAA+ ATPase superfamily predicted ATPase